MKKALRYTPLAAAALLFAASCTKEHVGSSYLSDPDAVRISAQLGDGAANGILATRSNPVGKGDAQTAFNSDDRICAVSYTHLRAHET